VVIDARALGVGSRPGVNSLGVENHASFATQGVRRLRQLLEMVWWVAAAEAVSAVRCLRPDAAQVPDCPTRWSIAVAVVTATANSRHSPTAVSRRSSSASR